MDIVTPNPERRSHDQRAVILVNRLMITWHRPQAVARCKKVLAVWDPVGAFQLNPHILDKRGGTLCPDEDRNFADNAIYGRVKISRDRRRAGVQLGERRRFAVRVKCF